MTLIYAVDDEVFLSAPRDVLEEVVEAIDEHVSRNYGSLRESGMEQQLRLFANSLRAHSQHLPAQQTEEWLDT